LPDRVGHAARCTSYIDKSMPENPASSRDVCIVHTAAPAFSTFASALATMSHGHNTRRQLLPKPSILPCQTRLQLSTGTELRVVVDEAGHFKLQGNGTGNGVPPAVPACDVG
jgi:hypothetical protein